LEKGLTKSFHVCDESCGSQYKVHFTPCKGCSTVKNSWGVCPCVEINEIKKCKAEFDDLEDRIQMTVELLGSLRDEQQQLEKRLDVIRRLGLTHVLRKESVNQGIEFD
jgi:hypothetical protein